MARKFKKKGPEEIESIMIDSAKQVGLKIKKDTAKLLLRMLFSKIAHYFFIEPDALIDVGFLRFKKNPAKEELFAIDLIKNEEEGVVNADTLFRYYKGDLAKEAELKVILNGFMDELIAYSQEQEAQIDKITNKVSRRRQK